MGSILNSIKKVISSINGTPAAPAPEAEPTAKEEPKPAPKAKPEPKPQPQPETDAKSIFNNAIDKRFQAVRTIIDEFREATGTQSAAMNSLYIYVIVDREDYNVKNYAWADDKFRSQLRTELDNALLQSIGSKSLGVKLVTMANLPGSAKPLIEETLYYSFVSAPKVAKHVKALITVQKGTGSLENDRYELDSAVKTAYNIGRSHDAARVAGAVSNDIVIRADDPDSVLQGNNNHVSSNHATITAANGQFYINARKGGCRRLGGAATKLILGEKEYELADTNMKFPLADGCIIELGKTVRLEFHLEGV